MRQKVKQMSVMLLLFGLITSAFAQREMYTINSNWKFKRSDITLGTENFDSPGWEIVNIPHTWNAQDVDDGRRGYYMGVGWYSKVFTIPETLKGKQLFIHFGGANQVAEVYLNGVFLGKHQGGYTAFTFDVTEHVRSTGDNELAVKVDNSVNPMIPPLSGDWTFFGGIYRDVHIVATEKISFDMSVYGAQAAVFIQTPKVTKEEASLRVFGKISNRGTEDKEIDLRITVLDPAREVFAEMQESYTLKANEVLDFDQQRKSLSGYALWSPENPVLYTVRTEIVDTKTNATLDVLEEPLAFRFYRFDGQTGFYLNGEPYKLKGVNKHQDYEGLGNAVPEALQRRDIEMAKELGANFLRIAHYPHDKAVLEACDRLGLLVSIEIPIVNQITDEEPFYQNARFMMKEMIHQYYNHPSIILWCAMNEVLLRRPYQVKELEWNLSDRERVYVKNIKTLAQGLHDLSKELDPYRYTMNVNHQWYPIYDSAGLTSIFDVVGWNLYPGWYGADITQLDSFLVNVHHAKRPDKPLIITEYGASANPKMRSDKPRRYDWTIDWAAYYHAYYLRTINRYDFVAGGAVWNLMDFSSEGRKDARPHYNEKGLMTSDRQPKDVYWFYKANWASEPVIKIAPVLHERRVGMQDEGSVRYQSTQKVWVYSNLDKVELIANGVSLGRVTPEQGIAYYEVSFKNGKNRLEAKGVKEGGILTDVQMVDFTLHPLDLRKADFFNEISINCGAHYDFRDDYTQVFLADKPYEPGNFGYVGGEFYMRGGGPVVGGSQIIWGTSNDPLYQTQRMNPEQYRFDVPDGQYEVTLHFAELLSDKQREQLANVLGMDQHQDQATKRSFDVLVNNRLVLSEFNIAGEIGEDRAFSIKTPVLVTDNEGISILFQPKQDVPVINAIQVRKMY